MRKTVETSLGPIVGRIVNNILIFKGVPYAAPPVGELRFAPPRPREPWVKPLEAFAFGPVAHQYFWKESLLTHKPRHFTFSEDCLTLNVWAPADASPTTKYPVFVYIHGGGFAEGSASQPLYGRFASFAPERVLYDGASFAEKGIVVVTINYRLGVLGFLCSEETLKRHGSTGNWGFLDQILALKWVRENIGSFGGDPAKVTVGGESAGAMLASALLLSPLAEGLFQRAIFQSGVLFGVSRIPIPKGSLEKALALSASFFEFLGISDSPAGLKTLQEIDPRVLSRLSATSMDFRNLSPFAQALVFDGEIIPRDPHARFKNGEFNRVDALLGFNLDEGSLFLPREANASLLETILLCFLGPEGTRAFRDRFPANAKNPPYERVRQAIAFAMFSAGAKRFADLVSQYAKVFMYRFNFATIPGRMMDLGAHHGAELFFVFGSFPFAGTLWGAGTKKLSEFTQSRWSNFIKYGDPNPPRLAEGHEERWPEYDRKGARAMTLDRESKAAELPQKDDLDFMADIFWGEI
ncbi:MAG: carboxylesterase family protein [Deltaproteobacteria bacterium]|jgi:para-nitrobenzyl esterase|nr:carboxylesterase family protein [Deltaproteobacteria bacterium]